MDAMLQEHGAKHVYRIPEGLRELCTDISREVLRSQPQEIYRYIAEYVEALMITRENAKAAVQVVNNIVLGSEAIVSILNKTGLTLSQIAIAAPRLQKAFGAYVDTVDLRASRISEDESSDEKSRTSVREILESTGASSDKAEKAATLIQAAFRGHYEKMLDREANGEIQWERAAESTTEILKRAGVSQAEAENAATLIQSAYRGYYTRRNMRMKLSGRVEESSDKSEADPPSDLTESQKTIEACAWLDMMCKDSHFDIQHANEAATVIQSAYRGYRGRKRRQDVRALTSSANSLVVDAIVENVRHRIIEKVLSSRENIPGEFENETEVQEAAEKIEIAYKKERFGESRLSSKTSNDGIYENFAEDDGQMESTVKFDPTETKVSRESIDYLTDDTEVQETEVASSNDSDPDEDK